MASAVSYKMEPASGRPVLGNMNFNLANFYFGDGPRFQKNLMATLHEITHALGFSSYFFPKFIDEKGNKRLNPVISFTAANGQPQ